MSALSPVADSIVDYLNEDSLQADGWDDCIVGICRGLLVYDREKIVERLSREMSREEAEE